VEGVTVEGEKVVGEKVEEEEGRGGDQGGRGDLLWWHVAPYGRDLSNHMSTTTVEDVVRHVHCVHEELVVDVAVCARDKCGTCVCVGSGKRAWWCLSHTG
jgi:hypothetical protein